MVAFEMPPNATIQTYQDALVEYMNNSTLFSQDKDKDNALSTYQSSQQREFHFTTQFNNVHRVDKNLSPNSSLQDTLRYSSLFIFEMPSGTKPCYSQHQYHSSSYYDPTSLEEKQASSIRPATYKYLSVDVVMAEEISSYHQKVIADLFLFLFIYFLTCFNKDFLIVV
jgi:hypothetical protein